MELEELNCSYPEMFGGVELVYRAKIPGGWLVFVKNDSTSVTFVPDVKHEWDGESLP